MSDHEFEKQVQRKMDELKLRPSDAVWTAVEKNIRQTRPRRRFGFWLPVGVVILITTGYLLYSGNSNDHQTPTIAQSKIITEKNDHSSTNNNTHNETNSTQSTTDNNVTGNQVTGQTTTKNNSPINGAVPGQQQEYGTPQQHLNQQPVRPTAGNAHETTEDNRLVRASGHSNAVRVPYAGNKRSLSKNKRSQQDIINTRPEADETPFIAFPQLAPNENGDIATGKAAPAPLNKRSIKLTMPEDAAKAPTIQKQRGPKWVFGAQANVGFSRITQSKLFQVDGWLGSTEKSQAEDLSRRDDGGMFASPGNSYNSFIATAPPPERKPAVIRQGLSYNVGLYAQRPLSKRLRLTIGLNYAFMSAHTDIGKLVERPTIVNMGTASANVVTRYYTSYDAVTSSGGLNTQWQGPPDSMVLHKYTYRFHHIELPVTVNWQINKGRQLPPFVLDAGLSISKLLSADALHYDGTKGIYYKDNDLFNKTFVNAILGVNVGLFQQSKTPVWIGPSLRYSLTGLLDKSVSKGQFMWSTGINARIQLSR